MDLKNLGFNFGPSALQERGPSTTIDKEGTYIFKVLKASDSSKVFREKNREQREQGTLKNDPPRLINLNLEVVGVVPEIRSGDNETLQDAIDRRGDQKGKKRYVDIYLGNGPNSKNASPKALEGNAHLLRNIAGPEAQDTSELVTVFSKYQEGVDSRGRPKYNWSGLLYDLPINATALVGRYFIGRLDHYTKGTADRWSLNPWTHAAISEDGEYTQIRDGVSSIVTTEFSQTKRDRNLWVDEEDPASEAEFQTFEERRSGKKKKQNKQEYVEPVSTVETSEPEEKQAFWPDDDLPF